MYEIIDLWVHFIQGKWLHMESIFINCHGTRPILPEVAEIFDAIDETYIKILNESATNPSVMNVCMDTNRLTIFKEISEQLEKCQKLLNTYLESKRFVFPRFFFISSDELLSILGLNKIKNIQSNVIKVFPLQSLSI